MPMIKVSSMLCIVKLTFLRDVVSAVDGWHQSYEGILDFGNRLDSDPDRSRKEVVDFLKILEDMETLGVTLMLAIPDEEEWMRGRRDTVSRVRAELKRWTTKARRWKRTAKRKRPPAHLN